VALVQADLDKLFDKDKQAIQTWLDNVKQWAAGMTPVMPKSGAEPGVLSDKWGGSAPPNSVWSEYEAVRYAVSFSNDLGQSDVGPWSRPAEIQGRSSPTITVPVDPLNLATSRRIYRSFKKQDSQFTPSSPIHVIPDNTTTTYQDGDTTTGYDPSLTPSHPSQSGGAVVDAVLDKAIQALGGQSTLEKAGAGTWTAKVTVSPLGTVFTSQTTYDGLDRYRSDYQGNFNGKLVKGVTVFNGDKGWRKYGDMATDKMERGDLSNEKRTLYLNIVPSLILPLKGKDFEVQSAPDDQVNGKPAAVLNVTGPDRLPFTLYFDKDSGLPIKQVARVPGFDNSMVTQVTTYSNYKDFGGIKWAATAASTQFGMPYAEQEITEYKPLGTVDPSTFDPPK
jgi:hypothetical protein